MIEQGQHVLVMGLARSGAAVAHLLLRHGCSVVVNDRSEPQEGDFTVRQLEAKGARFVFGGHPLSLLDARLDYIVKNPGIPYTVPLLAAAVDRNIPIYTEIEVASWLTKSPLVAITGSNGKTTTTTVVGEILTAAGYQPVVAGNIGTVLSGVVENVEAQQPIVIEVSSFQLLGTETLHPRVAGLLNLYPAHLDYHQTYEAYVEAKWRLFRNMRPGDTAVLNFDQREIRERAGTLSADIVGFSRQGPVKEGVFVEHGEVVVHRRGDRVHLLPVSAIALKGEHNLENIIAASAVALWSGASPEAVRHVLTRFQGVEHRLEYVRSVQGVDYYNDSKATNPTAALQALKSFDKPLVWIAGGLERGDDFYVLADWLRARVKAAVLVGQSAAAIASVCAASAVPTVSRVATIEEGVRVAARLAEPGDVVLLSPGSASWDMFSSFEERGRIFKHAVHTL